MRMNKNKKIEWKKCNNCDFIQHKSHLRCLNCKSKEFTIIEAIGNCKLLTFTVLKALPAEFLKKGSYALGVVEFENGIKALGQITTQENLKVGMELTPVYKKICDSLDGNEVFSYVFEPV
jgi:uncharacterized OB-fold protein